jgi:hypothetical protein
VDPVPDPLLFFLVVPGIEPGPPDLLREKFTFSEEILCIKELDQRPVFYCFVILKVKEKIPVDVIALSCYVSCVFLCEPTCTNDVFILPEMN